MQYYSDPLRGVRELVQFQPTISGMALCYLLDRLRALSLSKRPPLQLS
jgi:hypothetical protein